MESLLNSTIIPYNMEDHMMDIVLYLFIAILLLVFVFKDYEKHKKSNWIQITLIGIAILNVGIVVFDEVPNAIEKSNWVYVMSDNGINLYNMGDGDNYSEHNLIESMNFSELTPYFSYEEKNRFTEQNNPSNENQG